MDSDALIAPVQLWMFVSLYQCLFLHISLLILLQESVCAFGATFDGAVSEIADLNFNVTYGDGEFLVGVYGNADVTLAGFDFSQQVAVADYSYWVGDGTTSGTLGLGFPAQTFAFSGTDATKDSKLAGGNNVPYE